MRMSPAYDWRQAAVMHRPTSAAGIAAAARDLAASGLLPRDIGNTLGITEQAVYQLLRDTAASTTEEM